TAASLTGAGSSARTAGLMEPRQNRVAKITRVIVDLTRLMVAPPQVKKSSTGAPSRVGWRSRGSCFSLPPFDGGGQTTTLVRDSGGRGPPYRPGLAQAPPQRRCRSIKKEFQSPWLRVFGYGIGAMGLSEL